MATISTVVFVDISGSTALYETLGNEQAAHAVTDITTSARDVIEQAGGRTVKTLGDGVLAVFGDSAGGAAALKLLMRRHYARWQNAPAAAQFHVRAGMCTGEVVSLGDDCYGDAVNMAARLCEKAGQREVWVSASTMASAARADLEFMPLGWMEVRGKSEPQLLFQLQWAEPEANEVVTVYDSILPITQPEVMVPLKLRLAANGVERTFSLQEMPVLIGRGSDSDWCVADRRVSRQHGRVDVRNGSLVYTDLSRYGTWLVFADSAPMVLRRESCQLHGSGVISLGVTTEDRTAPCSMFSVYHA